MLKADRTSTAIGTSVDALDPEDGALWLDEEDVRAAVRLVAEALTPDDGYEAKASRLAKGLARLVDATVWSMVRSRLLPEEQTPANIDHVYGGADERQYAAVLERHHLPVAGAPAPEVVAVGTLIGQGRSFTRSIGQMVAPEVWERPEHEGRYTELGLGPHLFSIVPLRDIDGSLIFSGVGLLRKAGEPDFSPRDRRLVHLVMREVGPLHRFGLRVEAADDSASLPPRLRTVLLLLVEGWSVKQIAHHLELSRHTVNDYCKQLHRHFKVSSRGELLRRFLRGPESDALS